MWGNSTLFHWKKSIEKILKKILTQSIEKSFLIDPLNTNNAIYHDSLTLTYWVFTVNFEQVIT